MSPAGTVKFTHAVGFVSRSRTLPLDRFGGAEVEHRKPVQAAASHTSTSWYWLCLTGRDGVEDVVGLGTGAEAEALRSEVEALLPPRRDRGQS